MKTLKSICYNIKHRLKTSKKKYICKTFFHKTSKKIKMKNKKFDSITTKNKHKQKCKKNKT